MWVIFLCSVALMRASKWKGVWLAKLLWFFARLPQATTMGRIILKFARSYLCCTLDVGSGSPVMFCLSKTQIMCQCEATHSHAAVGLDVGRAASVILACSHKSFISCLQRDHAWFKRLQTVGFVALEDIQVGGMADIHDMIHRLEEDNRETFFSSFKDPGTGNGVL